MEAFVFTMLRKNRCKSKIRSITFEEEWLLEIRIDQDWRCDKRLLKVLECLMCFCTPLKLVFTNKASQRSNNLGIVLDENLIEICKAEKTLNVPNGC